MLPLFRHAMLNFKERIPTTRDVSSFVPTPTQILLCALVSESGSSWRTGLSDLNMQL
jgi:hypothetical protein